MAGDVEAPRDYPALRAEIVARHDRLPKRLAQVASFAVGNPDEIAFGTAASIAAKANVQPSTLIRFSRTMGYQGFTELQAVFRHLRDRVPDYETRLKALSGADTASKLMLLFESFCRAGERSLDGLRSRMDAERLGQAVDVLAAARTIYLLGLRRSFPVVSYMAYALGKLAIRNVLVDGVAGLAPEIGSFAEPGDALFAVSFTPMRARPQRLPRRPRSGVSRSSRQRTARSARSPSRPRSGSRSSKPTWKASGRLPRVSRLPPRSP